MAAATETSLTADSRPAASGPDGCGPSGPAAARWFGQVLCWVLVLLLGGVLVVAVVVPRLTGATAYTVLSGSMGRAHPVGSLIVVRPTDPAEVALGEVVTYQLRSGDPTVVTHRVVASRMDGEERVFLTQGDVNPRPDSEPVRSVQVRGVVWYTVPGLGYVNHALDGAVRGLLVQVAALGLTGYAVWSFAGALADRRSGRHPRGG